ncbi:MAG: hypothetical protein BRD50_01875 [Bacteroidetes bacterium SW_11_45_7]|nr:MAG: hypothetical protein BRD50_01875 [Bacteroidetes bacterium SW_11_45_7]
MYRFLFCLLLIGCVLSVTLHHEVIAMPTDTVFRDMQKALKKPQEVKRLHLANCQEGLPVKRFDELTNLEELTIRKCPQLNLDTLAHYTGGLSKLDHLALEDSDYKYLPANIDTLANLQTLSLRSNKLRRLPDSIVLLDNIEELDLHANNYLSLVLPGTMEQLSALPKLRTLDMGFSQIESIPSTISSLTNLQTLDLSGNLLKNLPPSLSELKELRTLNISRNINLPMDSTFRFLADLPKLKKLKVRSCELTELPQNVGQLQQLQHLDLKGNILKSLPSSIGNLGELRHLNLGYGVLNERMNQIPKLPSSMGNLTELRWLNLAALAFSPRFPGWRQRDGVASSIKAGQKPHCGYSFMDR